MNNDNGYHNICVIIPAYNPAAAVLLSLLDGLTMSGFNKIVLINDGSHSSWDPLFDNLEKQASVKVLKHNKNKGKGAALKTGLRYVIKNFQNNSLGVVTVDADGQHAINSIQAVSQALIKNRHDVVLGVRSFSHKGEIPLRCLVGNIITKNLFKVVHGIALEDTQTGLRGLPKPLLKQLVALTPNRYDFEMDALILFKKLGYPIKQIKIDTVYTNKNRTSHFRPIVDSFKIYFVLFREAGH